MFSKKLFDFSLPMNTRNLLFGSIYLVLSIGKIYTAEKMNVFPLKDAELDENGTIPDLRITDSRYVIMRKRVTWHEAHVLCEKIKRQNRLAVFPKMKDAYEVSLKLFDMSDKYTPEYDTKNATTEWGLDRRYWIGLVDFLEEEDWQWVKTDGMMLTYDFWFPGQPDHNLGTNSRPEHCATFWNPIYYNNEYHTFNDECCVNRHYFICEEVPDSEIANVETVNAMKGRKLGKFESVKIDEEGGNHTLPFGVTVGDSEEAPPRRGGGGDRTSDSKESESLETSGEADVNAESDSNEMIKNLSAEMISHEEQENNLDSSTDASRAKKSKGSKSKSRGRGKRFKAKMNVSKDSVNSSKREADDLKYASDIRSLNNNASSENTFANVTGSNSTFQTDTVPIDNQAGISSSWVNASGIASVMKTTYSNGNTTGNSTTRHETGLVEGTAEAEGNTTSVTDMNTTSMISPTSNVNINSSMIPSITNDSTNSMTSQNNSTIVDDNFNDNVI